MTLTSKKSWTLLIATAVAILPLVSIMASSADASYNAPSDTGKPYDGGNDNRGY